jgi:hypothetical protein
MADATLCSATGWAKAADALNVSASAITCDRALSACDHGALRIPSGHGTFVAVGFMLCTEWIIGFSPRLRTYAFALEGPLLMSYFFWDPAHIS